MDLQTAYRYIWQRSIWPSNLGLHFGRRVQLNESWFVRWSRSVFLLRKIVVWWWPLWTFHGRCMNGEEQNYGWQEKVVIPMACWPLVSCPVCPVVNVTIEQRNKENVGIHWSLAAISARWQSSRPPLSSGHDFCWLDEQWISPRGLLFVGQSQSMTGLNSRIAEITGKSRSILHICRCLWIRFINGQRWHDHFIGVVVPSETLFSW